MNISHRMTESGLRSFLPGFSIYKFMLRGKWKKRGGWHPAATLLGKSKCQWARIGNVQILEQKKKDLGVERQDGHHNRLSGWQGPPGEPGAQKKSVVYQHENKTPVDQRYVLFYKMKNKASAIHSAHIQFIFNFMLILSARLWFRLHLFFFFFFLTIIMKKRLYSCGLRLFFGVLAPSTDSGQCHFNVIIWMEQSSWRQWTIFSVQIAFHFSPTANWIETKLSLCLALSLSLCLSLGCNRPVFLPPSHAAALLPTHRYAPDKWGKIITWVIVWCFLMCGYNLHISACAGRSRVESTHPLSRLIIFSECSWNKNLSLMFQRSTKQLSLYN